MPVLKKMKQNIHILTGNGQGKTTSALGVALRMLGHGKKVLMIQFMKGRKDIGEYKIKKVLKNFQVKQFGKRRFVNLKKTSRNDKQLALKGFEFIKHIRHWPDLLILDEICLAVAIGLLEVDDVIDFLQRVPAKTEVYLTGRYASTTLLRAADFVTEVKAKKMPAKPVNRKGVTY